MLNAFLYGLVAGAFTVGVLSALANRAYQRLLLSKARDRECECILGEFVYLVPETEYVDKVICGHHDDD
jgi:hypothetical protein